MTNAGASAWPRPMRGPMLAPFVERERLVTSRPSGVSATFGLRAGEVQCHGVRRRCLRARAYATRAVKERIAREGGRSSFSRQLDAAFAHGGARQAVAPGDLASWSRRGTTRRRPGPGIRARASRFSGRAVRRAAGGGHPTPAPHPCVGLGSPAGHTLVRCGRGGANLPTPSGVSARSRSEKLEP